MGKCVSVQQEEIVQSESNTESQIPSLTSISSQDMSEAVSDKTELHKSQNTSTPTDDNVRKMHNKLKKMTSVKSLLSPSHEIIIDDRSSVTNDEKYENINNDNECIKRFVFVSLNQLYEQLNSGCQISEDILSNCIICTNCSRKEFYILFEHEKEKQKAQNTKSVAFYHTFLSFIALKDTHNLVFWLQHNNPERKNNWRRINKKLLFLGYNKINLHKSYWRKNYQNFQDFDDGWHFTTDGLEEINDGQLYEDNNNDIYDQEYSLDQLSPPNSVSTTKLSNNYSYSDIKIDANCNIKIVPSKEQLMISKYGSDIDSIVHLLKSPMNEYYRPLMEIMYQSNPKYLTPVIKYCSTVQYN